MTSELVSVEVPGGRLAVERWAGPGAGSMLVLLHAGVTDRRSWSAVVPHLTIDHTVVAYDRRGFGESPPAQEPFTHVTDLRAVLDVVAADAVWLVGCSQGGRIALDAVLTYPDRVAGLVLINPAVSGAPNDVEADEMTARLSEQIEAADAAGDLAEVNRLEARLWLDGPAGPEGRVSGPVRDLFLAMNAITLRSAAESEQTGNSGLPAWTRLGEITVPVTVAGSELDIEVLRVRSQQLAERLPNATGRELVSVAHLPELEDPSAVADLVRLATG